MKKKVVDILEKAKADIQLAMLASGVNASGRTSDSLRVVEYDGGVKLVAGGDVAPFSTLENGRKPGKIPYGFQEVILQWIKDKGLSVNETQDRRFAGAIAWGKIRTRGFGRPSSSDYGSSEKTIYTPVIDDVRRQVGELAKVTIIQALK